MTRVRTGVSVPHEIMELWDAYAKARGISRNAALSELIYGYLAPDKLEIKEEVVARAIATVREVLKPHPELPDRYSKEMLNPKYYGTVKIALEEG